MRVALVETERALSAIAQDERERALKAARQALFRAASSEDKMAQQNSTGSVAPDEADDTDLAIVEAIEAFISWLDAKQSVMSVDSLSEEAQHMLVRVSELVATKTGMSDVMVPLLLWRRVCQTLQQDKHSSTCSPQSMGSVSHSPVLQDDVLELDDGAVVGGAAFAVQDAMWASDLSLSAIREEDSEIGDGS